MTTKPEKPRIDQLPILEIVPVERQVVEEGPAIEHLIDRDFVESVWQWRWAPKKGEKVS